LEKVRGETRFCLEQLDLLLSKAAASRVKVAERVTDGSFL
jgi:hypothetical protein